MRKIVRQKVRKNMRQKVRQLFTHSYAMLVNATNNEDEIKWYDGCSFYKATVVKGNAESIAAFGNC